MCLSCSIWLNLVHLCLNLLNFHVFVFVFELFNVVECSHVFVLFNVVECRHVFGLFNLERDARI
jgi:hypothetical protein